VTDDVTISGERVQNLEAMSGDRDPARLIHTVDSRNRDLAQASRQSLIIVGPAREKIRE
jgi:hypothetical protein